MLDLCSDIGKDYSANETLSEHVFRLIQAAIVKGEIAPAARFRSLSLRAHTA